MEYGFLRSVESGFCEVWSIFPYSTLREVWSTAFYEVWSTGFTKCGVRVFRSVEYGFLFYEVWSTGFWYGKILRCSFSIRANEYLREWYFLIFGQYFENKKKNNIFLFLSEYY